MEPKLLKRGDVILLQDGMTVYAQIPEMFVYENSKFNKQTTDSVVVIGHVYKNDTNIESVIDGIANRIIDAFSYEGVELKTKDAISFVKSKIKQPDEEAIVLKGGEFVVYHTSSEGGGTGMGPHDVYPNGHRVYCKRLKDGKFDLEGTDINFYQTGSFTAMIQGISPIRTIKLS